MLRRLSYWAIGVALGLLVLIGVGQTIKLQLDIEAQEAQRAEAALSNEARRWDLEVNERSADWMQSVEDLDAEGTGSRERYYRERSTFFEAIYRWERLPGSQEVRWTYPMVGVREDLPTINRSPCISQIRRQERRLPPEDLPPLFLTCAKDADPQVALFASTEAASRLLEMGKPAQAANALMRPGMALLTLSEAQNKGISARRVTLHRSLHAQALAQGGRPRFAVAEYEELVKELIHQPGPVLEQILAFLEGPIQADLQALAPESEVLAMLRQELPRARTRLQGWQEVEARLAPRSEPGALQRVVIDPYGSPWILVYSSVGADNYSAVQLDESAMLESFAQRSATPEFLVVARLSDGELRYGDGLASMATTQFPRMLAHLRIGYSQAFFEEARSRYRNSLLSTLLSILVGGAIGVAALAARVAADRRREELAVRQREFATRVTHELKTPLAGIRVMAENIELGAAGDPAVARAFARRILTESDKLTARIDEILSVARTRTPARPQHYDIEELLDGALDEWEPRFEDAGVELIRDVEPVGEAFGDPALMRDAMVCLLDNAIKYKRTDRPSRVEVKLSRQKDEAELSVSDNGIGVPKSKREAIFQPFVRVEGPDRGLSGGHGLGLSFVNDAVDSQKGSVRCEEGIAGGARFVLRLPLQN